MSKSKPISNVQQRHNAEVLEILQMGFDEKMYHCDQANQMLEARNAVLEIALKEYNDLYNNAPCGYHSIDENGIIVRINNTELTLLGYERAEVEGRMHISHFHTPASYERMKEAYPQFMKTGFSLNKEYTFKHKNGHEVPILLSATAIYDEKGRYKMSRSVVIDISERKALEAQLKEANAYLYHANQDKNRFIGIASHDLQNPLAAIAMTAELLQKTGANLTEVQKKLVRNIRTSADRMSSLIKDILNINRIERGIIKPDFKPTNVKSCTWDVVNRHSIFAEKKQLAIHFNAPEPDLSIESDCQYIVQIFENLLSNAIKFSPTGRNIYVNILRQEAEVAISIRDEGPGIPEAELPLLFGKFQRLSTRPTQGEQSTGLGLSIVKEATELLKGRVVAESKVGYGTTFTVFLPLKA